MKIIVFPGLADPYTYHKAVYDLLKNEAQKRNFSEFILQNYPGHYSYNDVSYLSMSQSVDVINSSIIELEESKENYIVLCRSFGCFPFVEFLKTSSLRLHYLKKVILWGPTPYFRWYYHLMDNYVEFSKECEEKGCRITQAFFGEVFPIELSINKLKEDMPFNIFLTSGANDDAYPEHFKKQLEVINCNPVLKLPERIAGLGHAVTEPNEEYLELIFGLD